MENLARYQPVADMMPNGRNGKDIARTQPNSCWPVLAIGWGVEDIMSMAILGLRSRSAGAGWTGRARRLA